MRVNLPVSNSEYPFPSGETLVSTTDLKGRITYCNASFVLVSGYEREELLGQPHNLIRHPDMPEEAYRDMWETIASGQPWSALVKNRRKDGSFYWVMANVTPLMSGGQPTGYMSVRTEASREQIKASEALYATMRAEKADGQLIHRLSCGQVQRVGLLGTLQRATHLSPAQRLAVGSMAPALVGGLAWLGAGAMGLQGLAAPMLAGVAALVAAGLSTAWLHSQLVSPLTGLLGFANQMAARRPDPVPADAAQRPGRLARTGPEPAQCERALHRA